MNVKFILYLSCFAAVTLAASAVNADPRRSGGGRGGRHIMSMPARGGATFRRGTSGTFRNWNGRNWSGDWRRHRFSNDQFIFIGGFGFPFYSYPYYGYYPYYSYSYGSYPYGYPPYSYNNYGYYSQPTYGYGDQGYGYGDQGYGYGDQGYGYGDRSSIAQLQRRLARAGYYHGAIDGIMGPETRSAIRDYERSSGALDTR
jgi:hypothetical protein